MATPQYPKLPIDPPYRIERLCQLRPLGNPLFIGAVITKGGKQTARVFKQLVDKNRKPTGWDEIQGDWQKATKPNAIALSADGDTLEVSVSPREEAIHDDGDNYPLMPYFVPGALLWPSEDATPMIEKGDYASEEAYREDFEYPLGSGKWYKGFIGRTNRFVKRMQAFSRFFRFIGLLK